MFEPISSEPSATVANVTKSQLAKGSLHMGFLGHRLSLTNRRNMSPVLMFCAYLLVQPSTAAAQQALTADSAAVVRASFLADLEVMREKFIGLAEAFPQDAYDWRPMDGTRSAAEVLILIAGEAYGFAPRALGGEAAMSPEEGQALRSLTDKTEIINHLRNGFAHATQQIEAIDSANLTGQRTVYSLLSMYVLRRDQNMSEAVLFVAGDMHEHLGQLIAYARANHIVPPWSR